MKFRRKKSTPTELSAILEAFLGKKKYKKRIKECRVFDYWDACVGENIASHTEPEAFTKGVLKIRVSDHGRLQQLQFIKEEIKKRLNEKLGANLVENLYFKIGALRVNRTEAIDIEGELKKISLTEKERERIEEATKRITDWEIRKSIKRAMTKEAKRKKLAKKAGS